MTYQEEGLARLKRQRSKQAIDLAMQGQWREAVAANKVIIESFPRDVDAYNRLGRAYMELGEYSQAREAYNRATELDPFNAIAKKNLQRLSYLGEAVVSSEGSEGESRKVEPQQFIEEIGKAGVVNLYHLAPREIMARMVAGDVDLIKVGTMNYHEHGKTVDWRRFGHEVKDLLEQLGTPYYLKNDLREAMGVA